VDQGDFGQQVKADLNQRWTFVRDGTVSQIVCKDGFEHVASAEHFLEQCSRVLKRGGTVELWVPHYKNPSAYRLTHVRLISWSYFAVYPEAHDRTRDLKVISNQIFVGRETSYLWKPFHLFVNLFPKWFERIFYVSNVKVVLQKI
jgi:ubiquinone/menaquinone biosynthesis C-methylase UbiE